MDYIFMFAHCVAVKQVLIQFKLSLCLRSYSKFGELLRSPSGRRGHTLPLQGRRELPLRPSTSRRRQARLVSSHPRLSHEVLGPWEGTPFSSWPPSQTAPSCFQMQSVAEFVGNILQ